MKIFIVVMVFCMSNIAAFSQGNGGNDPDFPDVPLDGGISLLVAAGAVYVTRRELKKKNNGKEDGGV
jgi:hypothetical protein